jgi:acetyl-CoA carboxylase biotin carboxyl carrier protein
LSRVGIGSAFLLNEPDIQLHHRRGKDAGGFMDLKDIKAIVDLMKKNSISEFELEKGQEFKIRLKRSANGGPADDLPMPMYLPPGTPVPTQMATSAALTGHTPAAQAPSNEIEIKSPMVGTFYRAPSPEAANYSEIGTEVSPDTVVCIIEAMKVMNEIKAEVRGVITQVLVENAKPVEFGQPLFKIRPL